MPDSSDSTSWNKWSNVGDDIDWNVETSTAGGAGGADGAGGSNNDGAMMLAQSLAAGAALLAAFSF